MKRSRRILLRDSCLVLPVLLLIGGRLILKLCFDVDFAPGADYGVAMFANLLLPLTLAALGQVAYAVVLIVDIVRNARLSPGRKAILALAIWLAVMWLYPLVYLARVIYLLSNPHME